MAVLRNCFKMMLAVSSEGAIYEKAPHFREGLSGGADGTYFYCFSLREKK